MKPIISIFICSMFFLTAGCSPLYLNSVLKDEDTWDENFNKEIQGLSKTQRTYQDPNVKGDSLELPSTEDQQFFTRNKPKIKSGQIMLDSGNLLGKIKEHLASITTEQIPDSKEIPVRKRLIGQWYGVDKDYNDAVIFTFKENGDFYKESQGSLMMGSYKMNTAKKF